MMTTTRQASANALHYMMTQVLEVTFSSDEPSKHWHLFHALDITDIHDFMSMTLPDFEAAIFTNGEQTLRFSPKELRTLMKLQSWFSSQERQDLETWYLLNADRFAEYILIQVDPRSKYRQIHLHSILIHLWWGLEPRAHHQ